MLDLYKNIKKRRLALGMSQEELAKKVGYADKTMISRIENGKVDIAMQKVWDFANALHCTPDDLMGSDIENNAPSKAMSDLISEAEKASDEDIEQATRLLAYFNATRKAMEEKK